MRSRRLRLGWLVILGSTVACAGTPLPPATALKPVTFARDDRTPQTIQRPRARWVGADWTELPGWSEDRTRELWPALVAGCVRPAEAWARVCAQARALKPSDDAQAREFLQRVLQPYRVEALDGQVQGLATGYFEPQLAASRRPRDGQQVPLYRPPPDLGARRPYWSREQLDTHPAARAALRGLEIAFLADPLDALLVQIQGSGRLRVTEPDGRERSTRIVYAGHNDHGYRSVGRWLIERGEMRSEEASWPAIRDWAKRFPERVNELLWANPRVVFFNEEPLPDESIGPRGAQGVPLTPGRSVAVDPQALPYGTLLWIDSTEPLASTPLRRAVMAQDTGSAIIGAVRVDYFWGWGPNAEQQAGRMKQPLRLWALWPRS